MEAHKINSVLGARDIRISVAIAGGGAHAITNLLRAGGASAWLEQFVVPYGKHSFERNTKAYLEKYVCEPAARALAWEQLVNMPETHGKTNWGWGFTSKLTYEGEREGREQRHS